MIQVDDHDNDSDDIPYSYEADGAHAVPKENQSDYDLVQTDSNIRTKDDKATWSSYLQHAGNVVRDDQKKINDEMEQVYAQEEMEGSYEFVQLNSNFDHNNDTEDIPDDPYYDPMNVMIKGKRRNGEPFWDKDAFLAQR